VRRKNQYDLAVARKAADVVSAACLYSIQKKQNKQIRRFSFMNQCVLGIVRASRRGHPVERTKTHKHELRTRHELDCGLQQFGCLHDGYYQQQSPA
jgi:hypothetical protein